MEQSGAPDTFCLGFFHPCLLGYFLCVHGDPVRMPPGVIILGIHQKPKGLHGLHIALFQPGIRQTEFSVVNIQKHVKDRVVKRCGDLFPVDSQKTLLHIRIGGIPSDSQNSQKDIMVCLERNQEKSVKLLNFPAAACLLHSIFKLRIILF